MEVKPVDRFLDLCCTEIDRRSQLAETDRAALVDGAATFRRALDAAPPAPFLTPSLVPTVPVAGHLQDLSRPLFGRATLAAVREIPWIPSPRLDDGGANVALGLVNKVRDLGDLTCGLILVAPGAAYPEHAHSRRRRSTFRSLAKAAGATAEAASTDPCTTIRLSTTIRGTFMEPLQALTRC